MMKTATASKVKSQILVLICMMFVHLQLIGQSTRRDFCLPDIPGYYTLKCDLHMHTMLSDGTVWPSDRVREAWRDGLDAIAITDHVEYSPHKADVTNDLNRSFDLAKEAASRYGILLIRGAEITRKMPPGHFNAIFLTDPNALRVDSVMDALRIAASQGAFLFWNHPGWKAQQPDSTVWFPKHTEIYNKGYMQGIEINNTTEYYPEALRWAKEKKLTLLSNSDSHAPINFEYSGEQAGRRPMTIVFAKEKTVEGIHEACKNRRTIVYYRDTLVGEESYLTPLVHQMVQVTGAQLTSAEKKTATILISNTSDFPLCLFLVRAGDKTLNKHLVAEAHSTLALNLSDLSPASVSGRTVKLNFQITNILTDVKTPLDYSLDVTIP